MKRTVLAVVLMLIVGCVLRGWARQRKLSAVYEELALGTTIARLEAELGAPWRVVGCGKVFGGETSPFCVREVLHASPLAPVTPEYWAFRYDATGVLIDKYHYVSP